MEKTQLNLRAPLLSTRRYSSPLRSLEEDQKSDRVLDSTNSYPVSNRQPWRPDVNTMEVMKPVSVPFNWEQAPGKAKGGNVESQISSPEEPPSTPPRLPPGRNMDSLPWYYSGGRYGELNGLRSPNRFPREQLNGSTNPAYNYYPTKLSGQRNGGLKHPSKLSTGSNSGFQMDSSREGTTPGFDSLSDNYDEDAAFSDAVDTFESFSINCSISGVSGSEYNRTMKRPRELPLDNVQSRDFMINRFLPAAKAMTIETTPQYDASSKKQIAVIEQPQQQFKTFVPRLVSPPTPPSDKNLALAITPYTGGVQDISEEDSDEGGSFEGSRILPVKSCVFLPWFCAKNSLKFMNPLPAIKVKTKNVFSSAGKFVKDASHKSPRRTLRKHVPCTNDKLNVKSTFNNSCELSVPPKIKSRPTSYSGELQARNALSPYRNYRRSNNLSPLKSSESPQSVHHKGLGFLAAPKKVDSSTHHRSRYYEMDPHGSEQRPSRHSSTRNSGSRSPLAKKTLYVDSGTITRVPQWSSISSKPKKLMDYSDMRNVPKPEDATSNIMKARGYSGTPAHGAADSIRGHQTDTTIKPESKKKQQGVAADGSLNTNRELILIGDNKTRDQSPLTPPLPKSPSDSWLSRNLASVSPRNSFTYSNISNNNKYSHRNAKTPPAAASAAVTKWETIVKSSHMRYDHGLYSQELVTHVSHPSRTKN